MHTCIHKHTCMISYANVKLIITAYQNKIKKKYSEIGKLFLTSFTSSLFTHELITAVAAVTAKNLNNFQLSVQTFFRAKHPSIYLSICTIHFT